jgi:hypothetical protein
MTVKQQPFKILILKKLNVDSQAAIIKVMLTAVKILNNLCSINTCFVFRSIISEIFIKVDLWISTQGWTQISWQAYNFCENSRAEIDMISLFESS